MSDQKSIMTQPQSDIIEQVIIKGDLSQLTPTERVSYYRAVCESIGLNPMTMPFGYLNLKGKLTLYALKCCTDQLRKINGVSIGKPDIQFQDDLIIVSVAARDAQGREDSDIGVVKKSDMGGELPNALMKAVTKAKRRVTLSLCGLGWLDETEVETIPGAKTLLFDDNLGPDWEKAKTGEPPSPSPAPSEPSAPSPDNGKAKSASLKYQPFVSWCNEWVKNNALAAKYAKEGDGQANMYHILKRVFALGYPEVTEENAEQVEAALANYVTQVAA